MFGTALEAIGLKLEEVTGEWKLFFSYFFQFAQIGFLKLSQQIGKLWDNTVGVLNAIGEGIGSALSGGDYVSGYLYARKQTEKEANKTAEIYKATIAGIEKEITDSQNRIKEKREQLEQKFKNNPIGLGTQNNENGLDFISKNSKTGGGSSRSQEARDTWTPYYEKILELELDSKNDLEKIEIEHAQKLKEFYEVLAENKQVSEIEKNNALLLIEEEYLK